MLLQSDNNDVLFRLIIKKGIFRDFYSVCWWVMVINLVTTIEMFKLLNNCLHGHGNKMIYMGNLIVLVSIRGRPEGYCIENWS